MKAHLSKPRTIVVLCAIGGLAAGAIGVAAIKRQLQDSLKLPKIVSKVKNLEVVSVNVEREGTPDAVLAIILRNNSDKPVVAVSVESGDEKDVSGISTDGFKEGDEPPSPVIEPFGTITMHMPLTNLLPNKPFKVSGVMYADNTLDGEGLATERLRDYKKRAKDRGQKGGSPN